MIEMDEWEVPTVVEDAPRPCVQVTKYVRIELPLAEALELQSALGRAYQAGWFTDINLLDSLDLAIAEIEEIV